MSYGFSDESFAASKIAKLAAREPENRFVVAPHSWCAYGNVPKTWGVIRYVPYILAMPWKLDGFVWFDRRDQ